MFGAKSMASVDVGVVIRTEVVLVMWTGIGIVWGYGLKARGECGIGWGWGGHFCFYGKGNWGVDMIRLKKMRGRGGWGNCGG